LPAMRVAVGLPSYQEADSIAYVVSQVDRGLTHLFDPADCAIVNVDGNSPDRTSSVFLQTPTRCRKVSLVVTDSPPGKGRNVLRFLRYCNENAVDLIATFDADVVTVTPEWVRALLTPVIRREAHYVTPLYTRSRFEAAITNHFAYPLFYGFSGLDIRQPIGGDFGLSGSLVNYLLQRPVDDSVYRYGIDIFMSMHAVGGGFRLVQAALGHKLHKPTFHKMPGMFCDVASAAVAVMRHYRIKTSGDDAGHVRPGIDDSSQYPHCQQAQELFKEMRSKGAELEPIYRAWLGSDSSSLRATLHGDAPRLSSETWADLLAAAVSNALWRAPALPAYLFAERLAPLFIMRAVTFWSENSTRDPLSVHEEIVGQAQIFRKKLLERAGLRA